MLLAMRHGMRPGFGTISPKPRSAGEARASYCLRTTRVGAIASPAPLHCSPTRGRNAGGRLPRHAGAAPFTILPDGPLPVTGKTPVASAPRPGSSPAKRGGDHAKRSGGAVPAQGRHAPKPKGRGCPGPQLTSVKRSHFTGPTSTNFPSCTSTSTMMRRRRQRRRTRPGHRHLQVNVGAGLDQLDSLAPLAGQDLLARGSGDVTQGLGEAFARSRTVLLDRKREQKAAS